MQILINGLVSGTAIALLAVAFQIVYLPTRVFFIGLAGIYTVAPFIAHACLKANWGWALTIITATLVTAGISLLAEWASHARLSRKNASPGAQLIASLGIFIILVQIVAMIWGNETKTLRTGLDSVIRFQGLIITGAQWKTLVIGGGLLVLFGLLLRRSALGLRLRALADNPVMFGLYGYNVDRYRLLAFFLCGIFAAAASLLTAYDVGFDPHTGLHATLLAIVAVIIGGRGSFVGPIIGGLLLGLLRAQVVWHFSARWQEAATFALLAIFLLLRPQGIIGRKTRLEAE
ncbi:MAG: branched-chain amino acid ABC transporter permease [Opitutales bacterium]